MSTITTEISSNSNSSCRLLDCLNSLPFHDQRVFRSLLGHIELLRLSACSRSLRSSIRNDQLLWQALYHRDFLWGAYYVKEMDFVLWCVRTDVNNPCTSDKRADLLENVDWYNTYRRRVSTENNWRYGLCDTTHIDMKSDNDGIYYRKENIDNGTIMTQYDLLEGTSSHSYTVEYLPHSNLRSNNNIEYNSTFSTSPNIFSLNTDNEAKYNYVLGDHYIAVSPYAIGNDTNYNVKILTRKHGGLFTTFDVPAPYKVDKVEGKWILLVNKAQESSNDWQIYHIMVFDIDNSFMYPGSIGGTWGVACFYETTNNTAIVYMARLVKDDDIHYIEWALYQFSSNNPVVQLRSGRFQLPERMSYEWLNAYSSYDSCMTIKLHNFPDYDSCIMHSVAPDGQSHTPRNCYTISDQHIPIPLFRAGCDFFKLDPEPTKVWTDLFYNDKQVLQIPNTAIIRHVIGDLHAFYGIEHNRITRQLLVDISTNEIIRTLEVPNGQWRLPNYAMAGMICSSRDSHIQIIQEYGEL